MSKTVKSFVRRITSPTHAGHGGRQSPDLLQSTCIRSTASTPKAKATKRKPESPSESLCPSTESDDRPVSGPRKAACKPGRDAATQDPGPSTSSDHCTCACESQQHVSTLLQSVLGDLKQELKDVVKREMQTLADSLLAPIASRISDLEDHAQHQREDISRISAENKKLRKTVEQIAAKTDATVISAMGDMEKKLGAIMSAGADRASKSGPRGSWTGFGSCSTAPINGNDIRNMVDDIADQRTRDNNVILRGLKENSREDLPALIAALVPDFKRDDIIQVSRLEGRKQRVADSSASASASASTQPPDPPRPVRAVLTASGKSHLMRNKTRAKINGQPVYVNHDLTRQQQQRRRPLVAKFKALRAKGNPCHLPKDVIVMNGKPLTDADIEDLLNQ